MISSSALAAPWYFNPRAPYGARHRGKHDPRDQPQFQSTRPIRGTTAAMREGSDFANDFNPRAPYGARRMRAYFTHKLPIFQSTRPIRGATSLALMLAPPCGNFNPRAPYGARLTTPYPNGTLSKGISIHAPHTGRDQSDWNQEDYLWYFNPRAPYGARPNRAHCP